MSASEWNRIGSLCYYQRQNSRLNLVDLQELLGVESVSFILRMERGEFDPSLLWHFWNNQQTFRAYRSSDICVA